MLRVERTGLQATVQDAGRFGFAHLGVGVAGPMDWVGHAQANIAVGNASSAPALELTGATFVARCLASCLLCVCGRSAEVDGHRVAPLTPFLLLAGQMLRLGQEEGAFRSYLAIAGGFSRPALLGSCSQSTTFDLGDNSSNGLVAGTVLDAVQPSAWSQELVSDLRTQRRMAVRWSLKPLAGYSGERELKLEVVRNPRPELPVRAWGQFLACQFRVGPQSNRMGYRLEGQSVDAPVVERASAAVAMGTVQLPPSGLPVVLMADRQTVGGYPVLGCLSLVDTAWLGRSHLGSSIEFVQTSMQASQARYLKLLRALHRQRLALRYTQRQCAGRRVPNEPEQRLMADGVGGRYRRVGHVE